MIKVMRAVIFFGGFVVTFGMQVSTAWANATTLPSGIPFKPVTASDDNLVYRAIAAFLFAGLAAYGLAWCIKRFGPRMNASRSRDKQLERLEILRLSARSALVRVRWGNEELLLGEGEHGVTVIGKRPLHGTSDSASFTTTTTEKMLETTTEINGSDKGKA